MPQFEDMTFTSYIAAAKAAKRKGLSLFTKDNRFPMIAIEETRTIGQPRVWVLHYEPSDRHASKYGTFSWRRMTTYPRSE